MDKIMQVVFTRRTDRTWWQKPELWEDRYTYSDISRPTEDQALANIHTEALIAVGHYRVSLSALEKEVDVTFTGFKQARSGYPDSHYAMQTAMRLRMPMPQVKSILSDIEYVKRNYDRAEAYNIIQLPNVLDRYVA